MIDDHLALPKIEELFMKTVRSSSRGAKKFSKRIQFDDFRVALAEMAEIKFPYVPTGEKRSSPSPLTRALRPAAGTTRACRPSTHSSRTTCGP
jgi:hypothetical protein